MAYGSNSWIACATFALAGLCSPALAQVTYVPLAPGLGGDAPVYSHVNRHHRGVADRGYVTLGYGETIISGRTGQHRSILSGRMVPDTEPPDFVLTGRASGSGPGANGFPGSNQ